jgi:hypothetical protein
MTGMLRGQVTPRLLSKDARAFALKVYNSNLEEEHQMGIITVLVDVVFALFLAALALMPGAIANWLKHRAAQRGAKAAQGLVSEDGFASFDFSALRDLPREPDRPAITQPTRGNQSTSAGRRVFPPAVPFNYPNN